LSGRQVNIARQQYAVNLGAVCAITGEIGLGNLRYAQPGNLKQHLEIAGVKKNYFQRRQNLQYIRDQLFSTSLSFFLVTFQSLLHQ